jgi:hypothetical protein
MAAALCCEVGGGGSQLCFHPQPGSYDTDTLVVALGELRRFLGGQKATLLWDGLPAHRSNAMQAFIAVSGTGWWWNACPPTRLSSTLGRWGCLSASSIGLLTHDCQAPCLSKLSIGIPASVQRRRLWWPAGSWCSARRRSTSAWSAGTIHR